VDTDCLVTTLLIPKKQTITGTEITAYAKDIDGVVTNGDMKVVASNDTGGAGLTAAVTAIFQLWAL